MKEMMVVPAGLALAVSAVVFCGSALASSKDDFTITIDKALWQKWGFEYPVTYVFSMSGASARTEVLRRDGRGDGWTALERKTSAELFEGLECVRFDFGKNKAYVSVGFRSSNTIDLRVANVQSAVFDSVARYYDDRRAAYTLSNDNWGRQSVANPGAPWRGMTNDASDRYQASVHACRRYRIPVSIAVNSQAAGDERIWQRMQEELDRGDYSWEPAVHTRTHPCSRAAYAVHGYPWEIVGCRDDMLKRLRKIPYGQHVFEFIMPCAYQDADLEKAAAGKFLFLRDWNNDDNPTSTDYVPYNRKRDYYGIGGSQTVSYDSVLQSRRPAGRYYAADVARLNRAFEKVYQAGGIFYAMWHADRYKNSVIYDTAPGVDGKAGSSLMQHFAHVAGRNDVWYVANGWLYCYRCVAENVSVRGAGSGTQARQSR